jgi:hypothetical protein|tara:strand:+ start:1339 stop:1845 length:507 start_codon:yes stop_codon:yes gene_type:complete
MQKCNFVTRIVLAMSLAFSSQVFAADTDGLANILKKIDGLACTQPQNLPQFFSKDLIIMVDDKRALLENRIKDYQHMLADFRDMNCQTQRQVLAGKVGKNISYLLVDEIISITSKSTDTDERQHSVCTYTFTREGTNWKVSMEHCSSLPDYSINPGDDALYYFHNPVY